MRYFLIAFFFVFVACTGTVTTENSRNELFENHEKRDTSQMPKPPPLTNVSFKIFSNTDYPKSGVSEGYGYAVYVGESMRIFQPNIPVVSGNSGFRSQADAEAVAKIVKYKVENHQMPPSITLNELDSIGISH
ncbi:MAG: DUF4907 domain-containing protein [Bacteroidetes bacterium]|nr:DUF4907 domain-containing protein [Bacteroidota bacterium]